MTHINTPNLPLLSIMYNNHLDPSILDQLSNALLATTQSNQTALKQSERIILSLQRQEGYIAYLLEIVNFRINNELDQTNVTLVKTAMTQLKVFIRKEWPSEFNGKRQISHNDQAYLVNSIVRTSFNISSVAVPQLQHLCLKLFKDIIEIIARQAISLCPEVAEAIRISLYSGQALHLLPVYLNIVLGLINNSAYFLNADFSQKCIELLKQIHPMFSEFIEKGEEHLHRLYQVMASANFQSSHLQEYSTFKRKYEQIVYLNIKLFYKALSIRNIAEIRSLIFSWITVAVNYIEYVDPAFTHQGSPGSKMEMGKRGSDLFNYFHGKKWAMKLLRRTMEKVLVYNNMRSEAGQTTIQFYNQNRSRIAEILKDTWQYQWPSKIKCELLRTLIKLIEKQPHHMVQKYEEHLFYYLQTMLPPLMDLSEEKEVMEECPAEFMAREEVVDTGDNVFQYQSFRLAAIKAWLTIAKTEQLIRNTCQDSNIFQKSLKLILGWTLQLDVSPLGLRNRHSACLLLVKLGPTLRNFQSYQSQIGSLVNRIVEDNLNRYQEGDFMLAVRAFELAAVYCQLLNLETCFKLKWFLGRCFHSIKIKGSIRYDQMILLLRGSQAFPKIVSFQARNHIPCDSELAKVIIGKVFQLVTVTDYQEFITAANQIIQVCLKSLGDCYKEIVVFLQGWFSAYIQKDIEAFTSIPAMEYKQNYQEIARGTIDIYTTILNHVRKEDEEMHQILDQEIDKIVTFIFSNSEIDNSFQENGLELLSAYLNHHPRGSSLNPRIVFLCKVMILRMAGLPIKIWEEMKKHQSELIQQMKRIRESEGEQPYLSNQNKSFWQNVQRRQMDLNLFLNCKEPLMCGFQQYVSMIRLFIKHIQYGEEVRSPADIFSTILDGETNNTEYLVYLSSRFYASSNPEDYSSFCHGKCFTLLMLIHYYQLHQRADCNVCIHSSFNLYTFHVILQTQREYSIKRGYAKYNSQLFCLWLYQLEDGFLQYFQMIQYDQLRQFLSAVLIYKGRFGLKQLLYYQQCNRCTFGLSTLIREIARRPQLLSLLPANTWIQIIAYSVKFCYMSTDAYADESEQSQLGDQEDDEEGFEEQQVKRNLKLGDKGEGSGRYQKNEETIADKDGQWVDDDFDGESEDCWQFEEGDDNIEETPLESHDDAICLLNALYDLYHSNQQLYTRALDEQRFQGKLAAILDSKNCYKDPSLAHFKQLCQMEEWQDQP